MRNVYESYRKVTFELPKSQSAALQVYDCLGQKKRSGPESKPDQKFLLFIGQNSIRLSKASGIFAGEKLSLVGGLP